MGFKSKDTQIKDVHFFTNMWVNFVIISFAQFRKKTAWKSGHFYKICLFWENCFYSYIYISTLLFNCTQMKMVHLSWSPPNMSSIGASCGSLGTMSLTSCVRNLWVTGGIRLDSTQWRESFPLFLFEANEILPMTPKAGCEESPKDCHTVLMGSLKTPKGYSKGKPEAAKQMGHSTKGLRPSVCPRKIPK